MSYADGTIVLLHVCCKAYTVTCQLYVNRLSVTVEWCNAAVLSNTISYADGTRVLLHERCKAYTVTCQLHATATQGQSLYNVSN